MVEHGGRWQAHPGLRVQPAGQLQGRERGQPGVDETGLGVDQVRRGMPEYVGDVPAQQFHQQVFPLDLGRRGQLLPPLAGPCRRRRGAVGGMAVDRAVTGCRVIGRGVVGARVVDGFRRPERAGGDPVAGVLEGVGGQPDPAGVGGDGRRPVHGGAVGVQPAEGGEQRAWFRPPVA